MTDRPIIQIAGSCRGCGRTLLVEHLLGHLPGWGALKVSIIGDPEDQHGAALPAGKKWEIVTDRATLRRPGTDTARYLVAGAGQAVWLRVGAKELPLALVEGLRPLRGCPGIVVESNRAAAALDPALLVLVTGPAGTEWKPSALALRARADLVILNLPGAVVPAGTQEKTLEWDLNDAAGGGGFRSWLETQLEAKRWKMPR